MTSEPSFMKGLLIGAALCAPVWILVSFAIWLMR
jgi:hypothetical protein